MRWGSCYDNGLSRLSIVCVLCVCVWLSVRQNAASKCSGGHGCGVFGHTVHQRHEASRPSRGTSFIGGTQPRDPAVGTSFMGALSPVDHGRLDAHNIGMNASVGALNGIYVGEGWQPVPGKLAEIWY